MTDLFNSIPNLQSWTKVLGHLRFWGVFQCTQVQPPPLTLQTMLDACIQYCFRLSTLYRVAGGGGTAKTFQK